MKIMAEEEKASPFSLKNTDSTFAGRSNDIFGSLGALEEKHQAHEKKKTASGELLEEQSLWKEDPEDESKIVQEDKGKQSYRERSTDRKRLDREDRGYGRGDTREGDSHHSGDDHKRLSDGRDYESQPKSFQFRQPRGRAPARQQNRIPDFRKHPERWTYYSLEDVEGADMSESSNKQAAFAFLEERRKLREEESKSSDSDTPFDTSSAACSKGIISFSKKTKSVTASSNKTSAKAETSGTVVDLPLADSTDDTTSDLSSSSSSTAVSRSLTEQSSGAQKDEPTVAESTFKKRGKGIKRSIRSRDNDDDD